MTEKHFSFVLWLCQRNMFINLIQLIWGFCQAHIKFFIWKIYVFCARPPTLPHTQSLIILRSHFFRTKTSKKIDHIFSVYYMCSLKSLSIYKNTKVQNLLQLHGFFLTHMIFTRTFSQAQLLNFVSISTTN